MFRITHSDSNAKVGKLKTLHGTVETPFFMPVATKASVKQISPHDLVELGYKTIIANSLVLYLRPGLSVLKKFNGIHKFMNFNDIIFTDSGGFQMLSKSFLIKAGDKGVLFQSPFDGSKHFLRPEDVIKNEEKIGADVIMALDHVAHYGTPKKEMAEQVDTTTSWAKRCLEAHKTKQLLFGITQGGTFKDLRKKSTEEISSLPFDGIAIGGLAFGEERHKMYDMLDISMSIIPKNKPVYLMGVGNPHELVECISRGIDIFDSRFPARNARHGSLFTSKGTILIKNKAFTHDTKPIDPDCDCFVCKSYSRAYINFQLRQNEAVGLRLASYHNLYFISNLLKDIRSAIRNNTFDKFKKSFFKNFKVKERGSFEYGKV